MSRPIVLLAVCAAAACSASTAARTTERVDGEAPAIEVGPRSHADVDLTGAWATGSVGEPAVPRLVLHLQCNYSPPLWVIEQSGDSVRAWTIPASRAQGVRSAEPVARAAAEGRVSGVDLVMGTADVRYVLRYDSTSGHLRGTLNGAPFWAVRLDVVQPEGCIPVP